MSGFALSGWIVTRLIIADMNYLSFFLIAGVLNLAVIGASYTLLKQISRGLAVQEPIEQIDQSEIVEIK